MKFIRIIFIYQNKLIPRSAGTPGVGKSRICAEIAKKCSMKWQDVSKIAKDNGFVEEYDESLECPVLDEDKVSEFNPRCN